MQEVPCITNSTIFVGYAINHATKTVRSGSIPDPNRDVHLLYACGHIIILPTSTGQKPSPKQHIFDYA